jgi:vacuolar protein sorting-associated protein 35
MKKIKKSAALISILSFIGLEAQAIGYWKSSGPKRSGEPKAAVASSTAVRPAPVAGGIPLLAPAAQIQGQTLKVGSLLSPVGQMPSPADPLQNPENPTSALAALENLGAMDPAVQDPIGIRAGLDEGFENNRISGEREPIVLAQPGSSDQNSSPSFWHLGRGPSSPKGGIPSAEGRHPSYATTDLEKHSAFFDIDRDGIITPQETYTRMRQFGYYHPKAFLVASAIHLGLGPTTQERPLPTWKIAKLGVLLARVAALPAYMIFNFTGSADLASLNIVAKKIHLGMHPSDTEIYNAKGDFDPEKFESIFTMYDKTGSGIITETAIEKMRADNDARKPGAKLPAKVEFDLLLEIASDTKIIDGKPVRFFTRQALWDFYHGDLFYDILERKTS